MLSRALMLVFAFLLAQSAVCIAIVPGTICPEQCPDDGPDGRCPPVCPSCPASSHPAPPIPAPLATAPLARREALAASVALAPRDSEPRDIFHVPKRLLA